jgi:hypothetical protein
VAGATSVAALLAVAPAAFAAGTVTTPISGLVGPTDVASADFDGDGYADLAIAQAHGLIVERNQSGGGVFAAQSLVVSGDPVNVATGDIDHDGKPDVATVSTTQRVVDLNLQDGAGGWNHVVVSNVGVRPAGIAVGDLNGDGWADIAVNDTGVDANDDYNLHLLIKNPVSGSYDETTLLNFHEDGNGGPLAVAIGDVNRDGRADLATANGAHRDAEKVTVFLRQQDGSYERQARAIPSTPVSGARRADAVAIGDLGLSGTGADVAVSFGVSSRDRVGVFPRGGGYFSLKTGVDLDQQSYRSLTILRVDGGPAIAAADSGSTQNVTVWSSPAWSPVTFHMDDPPAGIAPGDYDGDGRTDLATLQPSSGKITLLTRLTRPTVEGQAACACVPILALNVGTSASFGTFIPGVTRDYTANMNATVFSTAGDAALTVSDPGKLSNGAFSLPSPLVVSFSKAAWTAPVANDQVTVTFKQHIDATDALRTGTYSKTLTFTLSTTQP